MNEENQVYFVDSDKLPEEALKRKHRLEQDPTFRTNHMEYMEGMEVIQSDIKDKVEEAMKAFDYDAYTAGDVERALSHETCSIEDFKALLSPAAAPYLEVMARKAEEITKNHLAITVYILPFFILPNITARITAFTAVFNCYNNIRRKKLTFEEIEHENAGDRKDRYGRDPDPYRGKQGLFGCKIYRRSSEDCPEIFPKYRY